MGNEAAEATLTPLGVGASQSCCHLCWHCRDQAGRDRLSPQLQALSVPKAGVPAETKQRRRCGFRRAQRHGWQVAEQESVFWGPASWWGVSATVTPTGPLLLWGRGLHLPRDAC